MNLNPFYLLFCFYLFDLLNVSAQGKKRYESPVLFGSDSVMNLSVSINFDSLSLGGNSESREYRGDLSFVNKGSHGSMPVIYTKRGHFRKSFGVCDFPPLRIQFDDQATPGTPFEGLGKIKLVTHCLNNDTSFDQYVVQEYLIYRIYNLLTERSLRVRLARITYHDWSGRLSPFTRMSFFLENPSDLAARINGEVLDFHYVYNKAVQPYYFELMSLFQSLIINEDWSVYLPHNIELVGIYPSLQPVAVPFDFDMAGLINIPYKSPLVTRKNKNWPERTFQHGKSGKKTTELAIQQMMAKRKQIMDLYASCPYLSAENKARILQSMGEFYQQIGNRRWKRHHW